MRDADSNPSETKRSSLGLLRVILLSLALLPMAIAVSQIFPPESDAAGKFVMRKAELYIRYPNGEVILADGLSGSFTLGCTPNQSCHVITYTNGTYREEWTYDSPAQPHGIITASWTRPPTLLTPGSVFSPAITYEIDYNYFDSNAKYITMNYQWLGQYSYFAELNDYGLSKPYPTDFTATADWIVPPSLFYALDPPVIKVHIDGAYTNVYLEYRYSYEYVPTWPESPVTGSGGSGDNPSTVFSRAEGPGKCSAMGLPTYSVNTANLNLVVEDADFVSSGLGPQVDTTRTYNADPSKFGMFGRSWKFPYETSVERFCGGGLLTKGSGQVIQFTTTQNLCDPSTTLPVALKAPSGIRDKLAYHGDHFLYEEKDTHNVSRYDQLEVSSTYRLTSISDPSGNILTVAYNADGTIQGITDASGRTTTFDYNADRLCILMTTPEGGTAAYSYDAAQNLVQTTDLLGTTTSYQVGASNTLTCMTTDGKTTSFSYSDAGGWKHIGSVTDARGNVITYEVISTTPRVVRVTDPKGKATRYASRDGRTTIVTDPPGNQRKITYANGYPVSVTEPNGAVTTMEYDSRGNMTKLTDPLGKVTHYTYDADDNLIAVTNPLNETSTYAYDDRHNLLSFTSPSGKKTTMTYNSRGLTTSATDPNLKTTTFAYTAHGNLRTVTDPLGNVTTFGYDPTGLKKIWEKDPRGKVTRFAYDANYRLVKVTNPDGTFRTYGYDSCAMNSITDENGHTTSLVRNPLLHVTAHTDAMGNTTTVNYDKNNNLASMRNPLGHGGTMSYDAVNRPVKAVDPLGGSLTTCYDDNGNVAAFTDTRGNTTEFAYDAEDRLLSTVDPLAREVKLARDALGRVIKVTNARGQAVRYTYDKDAGMTKKSYGTTEAASFTYDPTGRLTRFTDTVGSTTYGRDALGRVTKITYPDSLSVSMTYDASGNPASITYPGGLAVNYSYDARNRLVKAAWGGSLALGYDPAGNLTREIRSNGTATYATYDANNRPVRIVHKKGTTLLARMIYTRNALGNTVQETNTLPTTPVLGVGSQTGVYNDANQISRWGSAAFAHDADGNLRRIGDGTSFNAVYDPENRLLSITRDGATMAYTYNGVGQRVKSVKGSQTRNYHHDHEGRLLFETNGNNTVVAFFIYAGKRLIAKRMPSGADFFYHFDKTGNTVAVTDGAGNIVAAYAYDPFGNVLKRTGTLYNPFTYVGAHGVMDDGNGLYFMKNRTYDAASGRFIHKDPIGLNGGANLYAYAGNNPVDRVDPSGLLFGIDAGETIAESWQQWFAEVAEQPIDGGIFSRIGGYINFGGAVAGGLLTSLWTRETSESTATTLLVGGACLTFVHLEIAHRAMMAKGALEAAAGKEALIIPWYGVPTAGQAVAMLEQGASRELIAIITYLERTPGGREALKRLHHEAVYLQEKVAPIANDVANRLGSLVTLTRGFAKGP